MVAWPSGLRRWFQAPVISMAWVRIPPLPGKFFFSFNITTKQCEFLCFKRSTGAKPFSRIPYRKLVLSNVPQKLQREACEAILLTSQTFYERSRTTSQKYSYIGKMVRHVFYHTTISPVIILQCLTRMNESNLNRISGTRLLRRPIPSRIFFVTQRKTTITHLNRSRHLVSPIILSNIWESAAYPYIKESCKSQEQKFNFHIGTRLNPHSINERFSFI